MLFNTMPTITNPKGMAINNRGFIRLSFFRLSIALDIGRGRGLNREYSRCRTGTELHTTVGYVDGPSTSCAPLQLSKNAITCLPFRINVTSLGKDCCLIVDSFEKNYREKKT